MAANHNNALFHRTLSRVSTCEHTGATMKTCYLIHVIHINHVLKGSCLDILFAFQRTICILCECPLLKEPIPLTGITMYEFQINWYLYRGLLVCLFVYLYVKYPVVVTQRSSIWERVLNFFCSGRDVQQG